MVHTPEALARQEERTERRRRQVMDAASYCFRTEGFHAASMNRIAAQAEMSVGHIYKLFDSKEAIIIALCERDFQELTELTPLPPPCEAPSLETTMATALKDFAWFLDRDRAARTMEVIAEAGRNPAIRNLVGSIDARMRERVRVFLASHLPGIPPKDLEARVEQLVLLIQGLSARIITRPDVDAAVRATGYEICLRALLQPGRSDTPS